MYPKIAIIGAGPGGCMLARLLQQNSIPCTIFEGEKSIDYRSQGGTLDLRAKTGLAAIEKAGLWAEFQKHARYDGEALLVCDKKQTTWVRRSPSKQGERNAIHEAPEIDRVQLRRLLIESLPADIVRWGYRLDRVEPDLSLHFENGQTERGFDLIVGADGAFSKVRNFLTSEKPFYSGIGGFMFNIPDAANTSPESYKFVNRGSVFAYSDLKNISGQQLGDESLSVSTWGVKDEDWMSTRDYDIKDLEAVKTALKREYQDWSPDLLRLIDNVHGHFMPKSLYMLPVGLRFDHKRGVTTLGDAAHLMTPFAGVGVNTAFFDAMLLTEQIIEYSRSSQVKDLDEFILEYEAKMWESAKKAQELTYETMKDMMLTPDAPRATIESWICRHMKDSSPRWAYPILAFSIRLGYFFYKLFV
ncbi:FAD/NAD(P)-binding domain-containing protein [Polyplosphaeria fusca]|uniref:FAD/NAD(P)-binding domain-containing protein n=1 Tax=Polyplosphaeria fusca TaxID=682080 RepID=A0A9P4QZC8_9PLEO|nr:FAD/NAD(P)-binding domain-containing protein [Polyplosphaeria fusca]